MLLVAKITTAGGTLSFDRGGTLLFQDTSSRGHLDPAKTEKALVHRPPMAESNTRRHRGLRDEPASASRRSATVALVLLLCQAQGLMAPAFQHHHAGSTQQAARPVAHSRVTRNHRRRPQGRVRASSWAGGAFRRDWNSATSSSKGGSRSRLAMMANPEGTQQLRDRDLEFMFYDEAQVGGWVGVLILQLKACGSRRFVCGQGCCLLLQSVENNTTGYDRRSSRRQTSTSSLDLGTASASSQ